MPPALKRLVKLDLARAPLVTLGWLKNIKISHPHYGIFIYSLSFFVSISTFSVRINAGIV